MSFNYFRVFGALPGDAIEHIVRSIRGLFKPSDGELIAQAISSGLHEYVQVADKIANARLLEAHARLIEAIAELRKADALFAAAQAARGNGHTTTISGIPGDEEFAQQKRIEAIDVVVAVLRELLDRHLVDFNQQVEAPLVDLLLPPPHA